MNVPDFRGLHLDLGFVAVTYKSVAIKRCPTRIAQFPGSPYLSRWVFIELTHISSSSPLSLPLSLSEIRPRGPVHAHADQRQIEHCNTIEDDSSDNFGLQNNIELPTSSTAGPTDTIMSAGPSLGNVPAMGPQRLPHLHLTPAREAPSYPIFASLPYPPSLPEPAVSG